MNRITQDHITAQMPDGTNLVRDSAGTYLGVTVKVWGPNASAVYLNGIFNGVNSFSEDQDPNLLLQKRGEYWTGFLAGAKPGDTCSDLITSAARLDYSADLGWDSVRIATPSG
jgi:predicted carbohydrate-binding protein with CBM48